MGDIPDGDHSGAAVIVRDDRPGVAVVTHMNIALRSDRSHHAPAPGIRRIAAGKRRALKAARIVPGPGAVCQNDPVRRQPRGIEKDAVRSVGGEVLRPELVIGGWMRLLHPCQ